jgi:putative transposase
LTQLKKQEEYSWLRDVNSQSIQSALRYLDVAYNNFFNKRSKFPKFKKKSNRQTFSIPQHFVIKDSKLNIPKCKGIKIKLHREIIGKMLSITISRTPSNKYFASVLCELDIPEPEYKGDVIGIDFGIKTFITTSDGIKVDPPKYYRKSESKLKKLHKRVSKNKIIPKTNTKLIRY